MRVVHMSHTCHDHMSHFIYIPKKNQNVKAVVIQFFSLVSVLVYMSPLLQAAASVAAPAAAKSRNLPATPTLFIEIVILGDEMNSAIISAHEPADRCRDRGASAAAPSSIRHI